MKLLSALIVIVTIGFSANSYATTFKGHGINADCIQWARVRGQENNPGIDSLDSIGVKAWVLGYLSGVAASKKLDFLKSSDPELIDLWIDNYCQSHPSTKIIEVTDALIIQLIKKQH